MALLANTAARAKAEMPPKLLERARELGFTDEPPIFEAGRFLRLTPWAPTGWPTIEQPTWRSAVIVSFARPLELGKLSTADLYVNDAAVPDSLCAG
jgi:hypothetical protein